MHSIEGLREAITKFNSGAGAKLRNQYGRAGLLQVFIHTSPFCPPLHYCSGILVPLRRPTSDSPLLIKAALMGLQRIYRSGYDYIKVGVMLMDLQDGDVEPRQLDLEP